MSVMEALSRHAALFFEVFPPRTDAGMAELRGEGGVLDQLTALHPDCIACTYGAGGADVGKSLEILDTIRSRGSSTPLTHFTQAGNTEESVISQLQTYLEHGVSHILIQQGRPPSGRSGESTRDASRLVTLIRQEFGSRFTVAVSCAPDDPVSVEAGTDSLKQQQDSGADFLVTQPCWDIEQFRYWLDNIRAAGITMPIAVGVMPVLDQAETISAVLSRSGSVMPKALCGLISENWIYPNPFVKDPFDAEVERKKADFRKAGIEYTVRHIQCCCAWGADGILLTTQNRFDDVARIVNQSGLLSII